MENNKRNKRNKSYYMGMMAMIFMAAIYLIIYPFFVSNHQSSKQENGTGSSSEYMPAENSAQVVSAEDIGTSEGSAQAVADAIAAIEGKESGSGKLTYKFKHHDRLSSHYEKHGIEMGFSSEEDYLRAANELITNPDALHKIEAEDGDDIYYLETTNEIVFVSKEGYIRTYFICSGRDYFDRQ